MLRACALDFSIYWDQQLPLIEFSYNNTHANIGMAPYEALFGHPCRSPVCWIEIGECQILGPEKVQECT